jgi:hypothetical protein
METNSFGQVKQMQCNMSSDLDFSRDMDIGFVNMVLMNGFKTSATFLWNSKKNKLFALEYIPGMMQWPQSN